MFYSRFPNLFPNDEGLRFILLNMWKNEYEEAYNAKLARNTLSVGRTHGLINVKDPMSIQALSQIQKLGWGIENAKFFRCEPFSIGDIHKDSDTHCALNIPVSGCLYSLMKWFNLDDDREMRIEEKGKLVLILPQNPVYRNHPHSLRTVLKRMELIHPTLVRTHVWHAIDNQANSLPRIVLSIRFSGNPTFEDMLEHLSTLEE